jgi:membrane-associated phospholipid phosphatase
VHNIGSRLTREQREIAEWWVDTPGITGTPAGHWVLLQNQLVDDLDLNLLQAGEMYGMMGMVLADSFIAAWSLKYQINLLRPVTYIQEHISRRWQPYIETPPFPEYPSGHSVVSGAAADMLTFLFGGVAFTDRTNVVRGLPPRSFTTFESAAYEAAISRLYGGIHFRTAIENGLRMGECITATALDWVVMRPFSQGE